MSVLELNSKDRKSTSDKANISNPKVKEVVPHSQPTAPQQSVCKFHLGPQCHIFHWGSTILGDSTLCLPLSVNYLPWFIPLLNFVSAPPSVAVFMGSIKGMLFRRSNTRSSLRRNWSPWGTPMLTRYDVTSRLPIGGTKMEPIATPKWYSMLTIILPTIIQFNESRLAVWHPGANYHSSCDKNVRQQIHVIDICILIIQLVNAITFVMNT